MQESFSGFGFVILSPGEVPTSAETSFSEEWHQRYFDRKFHAVDPVFHFTKQCGGRSASKLLSQEEMYSPLFEEARPFGADSNFISVSVFGGNRMIFGGVNHDLDGRAASPLHHACQAAHKTVLLEGVDNLSDGQIDFMEMCEEGMLDKQVASELRVSISAIAQRKKVICSKLGVSNFRAALSLYSIRKWSGIIPVI
ncbi:autoinducer binding domain-containing protein [Leisingera sp. M527]|uniref:helix-turn-helix transcriptional regulator n=1 Tax=Leisingera sp. M527 TaxID=2867014 RepID=UPI0021A3F257|nr:autoinducer binding domain-containing protein [Leisingera sp. M527]UWQ31307.1 autoinducer binding domain-containing protein [Leisingera sp. M527]